MGEPEDDVHREVADVHDVFVAWFNGTAGEGALDRAFAPRLSDKMFLASLDGNSWGATTLSGCCGFQDRSQIRVLRQS